ncbi:MAG: DUF692 domain-containing protein [Gammaproteobacteria bacterium]|nr:DUF692 domain-containing protein [Gammaproteobacteria bacterium]
MNAKHPGGIAADNKAFALPLAGTGIGLRSPHVSQILTEKPAIAWLELLADNHFAEGGLIAAQLDAICDLYPVTLHSVGLSLGSTADTDRDYLNKLKRIKDDHCVHWLSDHLCFSSDGGIQSHDLLPVPFTQQSINTFVDNISRVQDLWGERILVENVSSYATFKDCEFSEVEFITEIAGRADCYLLVDINNLYVNHINHGTDTRAFINGLPRDRVKEIHLAGHEDHGQYLLDSHNSPVSEAVWALYRQFIQKHPSTPTLIEWDNNIPALDVLLQEAAQAEKIANHYQAQGRDVA